MKSTPVKRHLLACLTSIVFSISSSAPTQIPSGKIIAAYQDWSQCNQSQTLQAVEDGVNLVIWFAINLGSSGVGSGKQPNISGGPDLDCVATVVKHIRDKGYTDVPHIISVGGWDAPHPDTSFSGQQWFSAWQKWNENVVARPSLGWEGFDGFDWDIEGVDTYQAKDNTFTLQLMDLIGTMSTAAKEAGYVVTMAPMESTMNPQSMYFSTGMNNVYYDWEEWKESNSSPFPYHALNQCAYIYAKYPDAFDLIMYQQYESLTHFNFAIQILGKDPSAVLDDYVRRLTYGWWIKFSSVTGSTLPDQHFKIPANKLLMGFGNGWAGEKNNHWKGVAKQIYVDTPFIGTSFASWSKMSGTKYPGTTYPFTFEEPRGVMFWSIKYEGADAIDGSRKSIWFAKEVNQFLKTRPTKQRATDVVV